MMLMMVNLKEGGEGDRERAGTLSAFPESFRACNNVIIVIIVDIVIISIIGNIIDMIPNNIIISGRLADF